MPVGPWGLRCLVVLAESTARPPTNSPDHRSAASLNQAFFDKLLIDDDGMARSELAEPFAVLLGEGLAAQAEATLASAAGAPVPTRQV